MATIPRTALDYLTSQINSISADAQSRVLRVLESIAWTTDNVAECRELVVQALEHVMPFYTGLSAQASADFYDAARELSVGSRSGHLLTLATTIGRPMGRCAASCASCSTGAWRPSTTRFSSASTTR